MADLWDGLWGETSTGDSLWRALFGVDEMATLNINPAGDGVFRVSGYAPASGFGDPSGTADTAANQTAAMQSALDAAAAYGQANDSVGVVLLDVPAVYIQEADASNAYALVMSRRTALIGEHVRKNKIIMDANEDRAITMIQSPVAALGNATFAAAGKTITRSSGDFLADGFTTGSTIITSGWASNNGTYTITDVTATVITVSETLINEGPTAFAGFQAKTNNITIANFTLDGNASNRSGVTATTWGSAEHEGVALKYLSHSRISNMYFYNIGTDAVDLDDNEGYNVVENSVFEDNRGCGIHWSGSGMLVTNIIGKNNSWYRLQSATQSVRSAAGLISFSDDDNVIENVWSENDQRTITLLGGSNNTISNVTSIQPGAGSNITGTAEQDPATDAVPTGEGQGIYVSSASGAHISDFVFTGRSSFVGESGILLKGSTTRGINVHGAFMKNAYWGVSVEDMTGNSGCQLNDITLLTPNNRGIKIENCSPSDDIVINNPVIRGGNSGIRVDSGSDSVRINDPVIYDVTAGNGIHFISAATDCTVNGGRITNCSKGVYLHGSGGATESISIKNIELSGNTADLDFNTANNSYLSNVYISSGPQAVSITAATDTFVAENEVIELSADGVYTMSAAALISNSFLEGQILTLINTGANTITLTNGNDFRFKGGANLALAQYDSVRLIRNTAIGDWVEI